MTFLLTSVIGVKKGLYGSYGTTDFGHNYTNAFILSPKNGFPWGKWLHGGDEQRFTLQTL